ncbi:hypothetical protein RvY_06106-2 [Ramazzottius varieornatus]|uniref:Uncharacterized protein n=1 Tax=Ramazzottius varieornatus TaxID=947166 RepID=A0A1D1UXW4_RAMVA|nr:hypothetical protein RvY_06106-2 [Ramazzottius varieornatus]
MTISFFGITASMLMSIPSGIPRNCSLVTAWTWTSSQKTRPRMRKKRRMLWTYRRILSTSRLSRILISPTRFCVTGILTKRKKMSPTILRSIRLYKYQCDSQATRYHL